MAKSFFSSTVTSLPTKSLKYEKNNYTTTQLITDTKIRMKKTENRKEKKGICTMFARRGRKRDCAGGKPKAATANYITLFSL